MTLDRLPGAKRRALGRGLGALIPGAGMLRERPLAQTGETAAPARRDFFLAPIEEIHPNPEQPRKTFTEAKLTELADSIRAVGIIEALVVSARPAAAGGGYLIIAGERRWRAAQRAGLHEVPVVVREASSAHAFELALIENVQRDDLNAIEEAEAYQRLSDTFGYTQVQIGTRVGKDRATVANAVRLLRLPLEVRTLVVEERLNMGHARALLGLEDVEEIEQIARKVAADGLSVRATEELIRRRRAGATRKEGPTKSASVRDLEQRLTRALGARVVVHDRGTRNGGKIEIGYTDLDELDRLLDRLLPSSGG